MGKGSRNRQNHYQDKIENPEKYKKKKQMPKWLTSAIALVVLAAVLVGVVAYIITANGVIKRGRVLVESKTGKFDVNQQMVTFIAWQTNYYNMYYYYYLGSQYDSTNHSQVTKGYDSADAFALEKASAIVQNQLRDSVDEILETVVGYVAVADAAWKEGIRLEDADKETVDEGVEQLKNMQKAYAQYYPTLNDFLEAFIGQGIKKGDVKDALELISMYNKYCTVKQVSLESAATLADLEAYRNANPADFYKIDYLTYAAEDEDFAKKLSECDSAEKFQELVMTYHLDEKYKDVYNQKTTHKDAEALYEKIDGKEDANGKTALTDALNEIEAVATETIAADKEGLDADLKTWLFSDKRTQYETATVTTEKGIYVIAFMSEEASTESVSVRYKFVEFQDGVKHGDDADFKADIYAHIAEYKKDEPSYATDIPYKTAYDQATAFKDTLNENIVDTMKANGGVEKTGVTSSTASTTLPEAVRDAALDSSNDLNTVFVISDKSADEEADEVEDADKDRICTHYVVYVTARESSSANVVYVEFKGEAFYEIIQTLRTSLDAVYPTDKTLSYTDAEDAEEYAAWLSELTEEGTFVSARNEFDAKYFEVTDDKDNKTYHAYMVVKNDMATDNSLYLDTATVVNGGYLLYSDKEHIAAAEAGLDALRNLTYAELTNAMSGLTANNASPTVSTSLKAEDLEKEDANLNAWLYSDDRKANEVAAILNADGDGTYVAMFIEKTEAWKASAKSAYVSEELTDWIAELSKDYAPSERVLKKLGEPGTTAETEAATTAASTEAAIA